MAGIYLHIPFCKQACHYCDFHFSTSLNRVGGVVAAMKKEIALQSEYLEGKPVKSIYFGGGTPSLLDPKHIDALIDLIHHKYNVTSQAEITIEVNPDDITKDLLRAYKKAGVNRLSIGVQSFLPEVLKLFNRAHGATEAIDCLVMVQDAGFKNYSIDLIYGFNTLSHDNWEWEVNMAIAMEVPHISAYSLTIEPKTAFGNWQSKGKLDLIDDDHAAHQFTLLNELLEKAGYDAYEISNFAKPGFRSKHNSSYWQGKHYVGIGPSAHSFNGVSRQYNIKNNALYMKALEMDELPYEIEILTPENKINERIMTQLRLMEGLDLQALKKDYQYDLEAKQGDELRRIIKDGLANIASGNLILTSEGKLMADGIAASLFVW